MKREAIMEAFKSLGASQGSYGRIYSNLLLLQEQEPEEYNDIMEELEAKQFNDTVDLVMFMEG